MIGSMLKAGVRAASSRYAGGMVTGYGIMQASNYAADQLDTGVGPYSAGGGITSLMRIGGTIAGGAMMGTGAIRGAGALGMGAAKGIGARSSSGLRRTMHKAYGGFRKLNEFSVGGYASKIAFGGIGFGNFKTPQASILGKQVPGIAKLAGKGMFSVAKGVAKAPAVLAMDTAGVGLRAAGGIMNKTRNVVNKGIPGAGVLFPGGNAMGAAGRALHSVGNKSWGSRMFALGTVAGGAKLITEVGSEEYPPGLADTNYQRHQDGFSTRVGTAQGRNMSLGGQQMYDPTSGSRPRRMGSGGSAGLVQSLHKLR